MIKTSLKTLLFAGFSLSSFAHAITATDPVGVVKIAIHGATAANNPTYSYLSTSMSQEVVFQGVVSAGGTGTITIGNNSWTADQFKSVPYYVIVASGTREGEMLDIASNTANTLTLSGGSATENQADLVGQTIRIHKHNTIASIFGADPAVGTVKKGTANTADLILLFNTATGVYDTYYFNNGDNPLPVGGNFHKGWVKSSAPTEDAGNTTIYPDDGFIYKRVELTEFELPVSGNVIMNKIKVPIINGYNFVTIPYPVDKSYTLANSGLRPLAGAPVNTNIHLVEGNEDTADQIMIFSQSSQTFETFYFNNATNNLPIGGVFHQGWVKSNEITVDASNTAIPAGSSVFILRRNGNPAFNWEFPSVTK